MAALRGTQGFPHDRPRPLGPGPNADHRNAGGQARQRGLVTDWSVDPDDWGEFLCQTFDLWLQKDLGRVVVNWFESLVGQWMGKPAQICTLAPVCGRSLVTMEKDGSLYSCDHFVYPEYRLGNLNDDCQLAEVVYSAQQRRFGCNKRDGLPDYCKHCQYNFACNGECPEESVPQDPRRPARTQLSLLGHQAVPGLRRSLPSTDCRHATWLRHDLCGRLDTAFNRSRLLKKCDREMIDDQRKPLITSRHNPHVKAAARLRDRRQREKQGRILIDGVREVGRATRAGVRLVEVFLCQSLCGSDDARRLLVELAQGGCQVLPVSEEVFQKLAFGQRAEGVLGVAETPRHTLSSLVLAENALVAVLDGVEKPGNVGAVLRSADAAGVSAVLVADGRTDLYNPNAIRASLGTIFTLPLGQATGSEVRQWLREQKCSIVAARVDGAVPYTAVDYRGPTAIVLGSEAAGLSPLWSGRDIQAVRLPMLGAADSLNVSVTAAVLFYEALRQRSAGTT